jgi:hypothetical protein
MTALKRNNGMINKKLKKVIDIKMFEPIKTELTKSSKPPQEDEFDQFKKDFLSDDERAALEIQEEERRKKLLKMLGE